MKSILKIKNKWQPLFFVLLGLISPNFGQEAANAEVESKTKPFAKIYSHWVYDLQEDADPISGFDITRAYFGAKHNLTNKADIKLTLDVGRTGAITQLSVDSNLELQTKKDAALTAFLKTAQLSYHISSFLDITGGLHGLNQFKTQESMWGYRYIYKSFMDQHKYGSSADLGLTATIKPVSMAKIYATVINGEGYKNLQLDDNYKSALGVELAPVSSVIIYLYGDVMPTAKETQITTSVFAGYHIKKLLRVGAEFNMQTANGGSKDKDLTGISAYLAYTWNQFELFGRFDLASSKDDVNLSKDGQLILAGLQYQPTKGLKTSLNFQNRSPAADGADAQPKVYLNSEFTF